MSLNQIIKAIGYALIACFGKAALADAILYTDKSKVKIGAVGLRAKLRLMSRKQS